MNDQGMKGYMKHWKKIFLWNIKARLYRLSFQQENGQRFILK